jgi:hypothetical protein
LQLENWLNLNFLFDEWSLQISLIIKATVLQKRVTCNNSPLNIYTLVLMFEKLHFRTVQVNISTRILNYFFFSHLRSWPSGDGTCSLPLHPGSIFSVHVCHPAVLYLPTGLAECSVVPRISRGARKLAKTPRVIKKNCFSN